eukprot:COSAG05_NODE_1337_length_5147_cov_25.636485_7_plen_54_part_01
MTDDIVLVLPLGRSTLFETKCTGIYSHNTGPTIWKVRRRPCILVALVKFKGGPP